jgi:hypothetical protein
MSKDVAPGLPVIRSVRVPGGGRLVVMRQDAFAAAVRAANKTATDRFVPVRKARVAERAGLATPNLPPPARQD